MSTKFWMSSLLMAVVLASGAAALAADVKREDVTVDIYAITANGDGDQIGTVMLRDSGAGLVLTTNLSHLPPGAHGFHVHANPDCDPAIQDGKKVAGMAAGDHFDPAKTGKHMGPEGAGHEGDLPFITADKNGNSVQVLLAPHLKVADVKEHALVIHEGGDNYSDTPKPMGGGGKRIACAVVY